MKRTEENLQYLRDKYSCRHYIKYIQNRGYLYCDELTFLLSIIKTINSYRDNGITPHSVE